MLIIGFYKVILTSFIPFIIIAVVIQIATVKGKHQELVIKRLERENRLNKAKSNKRIQHKKDFINESRIDLEYDYYQNGQAYKDFNKKK